MDYWTKTIVKKKITCDLKKYVAFLLTIFEKFYANCEFRF